VVPASIISKPEPESELRKDRRQPGYYQNHRHAGNQAEAGSTLGMEFRAESRLYETELGGGGGRIISQRNSFLGLTEARSTEPDDLATRVE
jgi:hypothetical protein